MCQVMSARSLPTLRRTKVLPRRGTAMKKLLQGKVVIILLFCSFSVGQNDDPAYTYDDDESSSLEYDDEGNKTDVYDSTEGRHDHFLGVTRPSFPLTHHSLSNNDHLHELTSLLNFHNTHRLRPGILKKRKTLHKKPHFKFLLPLLLSALAKVAHFLPIVKLTLLALFALVLFSKKALLVSLGSLILVLYDSFYKGKNQSNLGVSIVKDRGSSAPTIDHETHIEDVRHDTRDEPWYGREELNSPKIHPREGASNSNKWKRWWAPQINYRRKPESKIPLKRSSSREINEQELLYQNFENILYNL